MKTPNESFYLGIKQDSFVVWILCGDCKFYLYNWSRNWQLIDKLKAHSPKKLEWVLLWVDVDICLKRR